MNERDMLCSSHHMNDLGQSAQSHITREPYVLLGSTSAALRPSNTRQLLPGSGTNLEHYQEHHEGGTFYGVASYSPHHHPATTLEIGVPSGSNFYNPYLNHASGGRVFPVPLNHGSMDHLPSSSSHRSNGLSMDDYGRNADGFRGPCKRKTAEGIAPNAHYLNNYAGPSSSIPPVSDSQLDSGITVMHPSFALPEYRSSGPPPVVEVGLQSNMRNRRLGAVGTESFLSHNYMQLPQRNCTAPSFQPSTAAWLDQQAINSSSDGGSLPWNRPAMLPYFQGPNITGGSFDIGNINAPGYHDVPSNHPPANFLHSPPVLHQHHIHLPHSIPLSRGFGISFHPVAAASGRLPTSTVMHHGSVSEFEGGAELAHTAPSTAIRIYQSHRRGIFLDAVSRHRNLPHLRHLPEDEVAILGFPTFYNLSNLVDHHREMRLDIDDMSYEELLALSERIGSVNTGLSEEAIKSNLKTKPYNSCILSINLEELPCADHKNDYCIICQEEYQDKDKVGTLDCGHEYHAGCLQQWLLVKNSCPICKLTALDINQKSG